MTAPISPIAEVCLEVLPTVPDPSDSHRLTAVPEFAAFAGAAWPERIMHEALTDRFHAKQGRSIVRWTLTNDSGETLTVYLKRHYELPRWAGLLARLFPGRAWSPGLQEWEHLVWAKSEGLPVPRPVAAGEFRQPWGKLQSFLAVEELTDMLPLHEAIPLAERSLSSAAFAGWKRAVISELARLARELHRRAAFHKDLYLCHFYIPEADCRVPPDDLRHRIAMIDFHRLGWHRLAQTWFRVKDLAQLLYSTTEVEGLTARDRLRFWKLYRGGDWHGSAPPTDGIRTLVLWKFRRYDRHNRKKAARK